MANFVEKKWKGEGLDPRAILNQRLIRSFNSLSIFTQN